MQADVSGNVYSLDVHFAEVHHAPYKEVFGGDGDDFVFHLIIISICRDGYVGDQFIDRPAVRQSQVVLCGAFRFQVRVAHLPVVQVVEAGQPEDVFIEQADAELFAGKGLERRADVRREFPPVGWRCLGAPLR